MHYMIIIGLDDDYSAIRLQAIYIHDKPILT